MKGRMKVAGINKKKREIKKRNWVFEQRGHQFEGLFGGVIWCDILIR